MITKKNRFHGHKSLNYVYRNGKNFRTAMFGVKYAVNKKRSDWRLAVVVTKKVEPSAVKRNRIRRRVYESFRKNADSSLGGVDIVITIFDTNISAVETTKLDKWLKDVLTTLEESNI